MVKAYAPNIWMQATDKKLP